MDLSLVFLLAIALVLAAVAFSSQGNSGLFRGLQVAGKLLKSLGLRVLLGFAVAGFMQVVIPAESVVKWIGPGSGWPGVFIGTFAGCLMPAGPYVVFPIVASLFQQGAAVGPLLAVVTAWSVSSLTRLLVWEIPLLGARLALLRYGLSFAFPPVVGFLSNLVFYRKVS